MAIRNNETTTMKAKTSVWTICDRARKREHWSGEKTRGEKGEAK
jgi:hypothetical protein